MLGVGIWIVEAPMDLKPYYTIEQISNAVTGLTTSIPQAIREDKIRYAIPIEFGSAKLIYTVDSLSAAIQTQITTIPNESSLKNTQHIHADSSNFKGKELVEETLYLRHSNLNQCRSGKTLFAHTLETLDGTPVNLWAAELATDQMWVKLWLELTELGQIIDHEDHWFNGLLREGLVSTKEIVAVTGSRPYFADTHTAPKRESPFRLYNKQPDRACKAICEWGNHYFTEYDTVPTIEDLRRYMTTNAANVPLTEDKDDILIINGQRVSPRSFKEFYGRLTK